MTRHSMRPVLSLGRLARTVSMSDGGILREPIFRQACWPALKKVLGLVECGSTRRFSPSGPGPERRQQVADRLRVERA